MKIILILMIGLSSVAQAKHCRLPLKNSNASLLNLFKPKNKGLEVPDGKCKYVKPEFMRENNFSCEEAHAAMTSADAKLAKKYDCFQPAQGTDRYVDNGVPVSSIFAICYVCQTPKEQ